MSTCIHLGKIWQAPTQRGRHVAKAPINLPGVLFCGTFHVRVKVHISIIEYLGYLVTAKFTLGGTQLK